MIEQALASFQRDGFVVLRGVLSAARCEGLREIIDDAAAEVPMPDASRWVRSQMMLFDPAMLALIEQEPVLEFAERLLAFHPGDRQDTVPDEQQRTCHVLNSNSMLNRPGDPGQHWHLDDVLMIPRAPDVPWDERIPYPTFVFTAMYYLTEVGPENGATELLAGSHRSGATPDEDTLARAADATELVQASPGDCLLFHHQVWHRVWPNRTRTTRYVQQIHYGARFIAQRFFPFPNHHMPTRLLDRLTPRQQRLLGMHPCYTNYA